MNDEKMKSTFYEMFGDMKEDLQNNKEMQENQKNSATSTNRQEEHSLSSNEEKIANSSTKKDKIEEEFEPRQRTRKPGERRGRKAVKHSGSSVMFEIDEELVDFFDQASYLNRMNKKDYLNYLIRKDMIERIGSSKKLLKQSKENNQQLMEEWEIYKKKWIEFLNQ